MLVRYTYYGYTYYGYTYYGYTYLDRALGWEHMADRAPTPNFYTLTVRTYPCKP